jgi:hypothetical protein
VFAKLRPNQSLLPQAHELLGRVLLGQGKKDQYEALMRAAEVADEAAE